MGRTRVDDAEALIPRSDQEEYHAVPRKRKGRCACCGMKCCFGLILALVLVMIIVFYFVYPSFLPDNLGKFKAFLCDGSSGYPPLQTITCVVVTSPGSAAGARAVSGTWGRHCTNLMFIYKTEPGNSNINETALFGGLSSVHAVDDVTSFSEFLSVTAKGPQTSWYLKADDKTYVITRKLHGYLSSLASTGRTYIGAGEGAAGGAEQQPYIMSYGFVKLLDDKDIKSGGIPNAVKQNNVTAITNSALSAEYSPITDQNLLTFSNMSMLHGVDPGQMYSFYLTSGDMQELG